MTGIYSLLEGKTLSSRYLVGRLISKGGMGAVFRSTDQKLGRSVAVKVIALEPQSPEQAASLRARFRREAHAAAQLRHPNVVTLHDFGTDEALGLDFIVMELLEGEDIQSRIRRLGPLPWRHASRILYEAACGLGAGHRAGLVHRDVKSANLFLEYDTDGRPLRTRVLDFGIAQLKVDETATVTHLTVMGRAPLSPPYASPEQQRGERELNPAADVWGLGVTAFEMLTGSLPYTEEQRAILAAGGMVQLPSLTVVNPAVPPAAGELIRRALSPGPVDRPRDGDSFAREIAAIRRAQRPAATPVRPDGVFKDPAPPAFEPQLPVPPLQPVSPPRKRWGARALMLGASLAVVAVLLASVWTRPPPAGESAGQAFISVAPLRPPRPATEGEIAYIRQVYQSIENGGTSAQSPVALGRLADRLWSASDSVSATLYEDLGNLRKIRVRVHEGELRTSLLFYYDAQDLVFVHEIRRVFGSSTDVQQRFYFRQRSLIRWRDTDNLIVPVGTAYIERAETLLRISDNLLIAVAST